MLGAISLQFARRVRVRLRECLRLGRAKVSSSLLPGLDQAPERRQ